MVLESILGWSGATDHTFPSSATSSDLGLARFLLWIRYQTSSDALFHNTSCSAHVVDGPRRVGHRAGDIIDISLGDSLINAEGATYSLVRSVRQIIKDFEAALFADELGQRFELQFEGGDLLPRLLELIVVGLDLLLASLVLLVKDHEVLLHHLFAARELMIH